MSVRYIRLLATGGPGSHRHVVGCLKKLSDRAGNAGSADLGRFANPGGGPARCVAMPVLFRGAMGRRGGIQICEVVRYRVVSGLTAPGRYIGSGSEAVPKTRSVHAPRHPRTDDVPARAPECFVVQLIE